MRCPGCGADNLAGMKFCGQCGAPLVAACRTCGADNPPEHKFCGQCGTPLNQLGLQATPAPKPGMRARQTIGTVSTLPGEMKHVTVLFCDIVNSTPLTERLGPEAMRDLVSAFLEASLAEVRRYGGTAPQFSGDGFMAMFGAPLAQEDHVRRALLAAIAMQRALGTGAVGADRPDLAVRIGIHTGPVVFGPVGGGLAMDPTVIGDTANLGARLQQAAEPGTILLSEETRLLAQDYARVEPVGLLTLKGKIEPTPAYRLLGMSHRHFALDRAIAALPIAFVGRGGELNMLNDFLVQAEGGRGRAVGVVGEPGIGKSRLLAEFRRQLPEGRVTWIEGRCLSYGTQIPYLLVLDLLRSNSGISEADPPQIVADKIYAGLREVGMDPEADGAVLLELMGVKNLGGAPVPSDPEVVKLKTLEVLRELCIQGSERRPLVLVLEDLHWVDNISEEFIAAAADDLPGTHILLLSTYRPSYCPPWIEKSYGGQIALQPLSRDESVEVVRSVVPTERLGDLLTREIVAKAEGNPFFLEQLALNAKDLRADLMVPNTIHDVVMARIDRLPHETKQLLQTASVIGREFSGRLLRAVWDGSGSLKNRLDELRRLEFINERAERDGIVYCFRHTLTQEAVYGSLLERHRRARHGAVAHALEELYAGRTEEVSELLALHFGRSEVAERAVDYAILAGEKSQRRWANNEALAYFSDALHRLAAMPDTKTNRLRRVDAVVKQGDPRYALGQYADYLQILVSIRGIVEQDADPRRLAAWHYWNGLLHSVSGSPPKIAIDHCREAAKIASAAGLLEVDALAEACLAQVYVVAGRLRDAVEAGERALSSFEARDDRWWAARTLWFLIMAANYLGEWNTSLNYCRRALDYATTIDDPRFKSVKVVGLWRMGSTYIQQGDLDRGLLCCNEALALAPLARDAAMARAACAYAEIKAGRVDAGIVQLSEVLAWFDRSDHRYAYLRYALWLAEGHLRRGDRASARPLIDDVLTTSQRTGYRHCEGLAWWLMGECVGMETPAAAEDYVKTAMRILDDVAAQNDLGKAMITGATLRQRLGDVTGARRLLDRAAAIFRALGTLDEPVRVEAALAALNLGVRIPLLAV